MFLLLVQISKKNCRNCWTITDMRWCILTSFHFVFIRQYHTHVDDWAVARQTGAVVALCSHYNTVLLPTVQIAPGAGGGIAYVAVSVAVEASGYSNVCFSSISWLPADGAHVKPTLCVSCQTPWYTWSCVPKRKTKQNSQNINVKIICIWCRKSPTSFEEGGTAGDANTHAALSSNSDIKVLSTRQRGS